MEAEERQSTLEKLKQSKCSSEKSGKMFMVHIFIVSADSEQFNFT